jgi:hypothetical protein
MLRFKILASVVPLMVAAFLARIDFMSSPGPCIAIGDESVELASVPWHADLHVSFTNDPAAANVRVQISDSAEAADLAIVDGDDSEEADACEVTGATQFVAIAAVRAGPAPVIYLTHDGPADYWIFVRSKSFTAREAAALIVGARSRHPHLAAASL